KKDAIIASNSSFIPSSLFVEDIEGAERLCNLHYFNPAMLMKLVEIVKGEHTSDETVEALKAFVKAIGKEYILVKKEIEGFVVNRLLRAVQNEAFFLYDQGIASFEDIDIGAEKGLNYPMGPFRLLDLAGIDICYMNRQKTYEKTGCPEDKPPKFLEEKYKKGEFGRKSGKGWYDYSEKK
ncbi:3-hydroxyacyl-CoA dehydrogenase family protein, partial [Lachnospiraceae bacterium OttesenSCG-928-D06]|nr:3-hydroxyacyl-CoA dehydrogenase family protein [Lachnospiraceae bacterium OttesenSCG-928-D06]